MTKLVENVHYELIPETIENQEIWNVRILRGVFVETVIRFGTLRVKKDRIHFDFGIVSSPDPELNVENEGLQNTAAEILYSVIGGDE